MTASDTHTPAPLQLEGEADKPRWPVFIVGSPRSGTSILTDALLAGGYNGFREGNFLSLISTINIVIDRHFNTFVGSEQVLVSNVDKGQLKNAICDVIKNITVHFNHTVPWFDKTGNPDMILIVPVLLELWPDCCFIFAKRRGIENIYSRRKKFPNHSFEYHCRDWARNMSSWRTVRESLTNGQFLEIDQHDIAMKSEETATRLSSFLHLSDSNKLLMLNTLQTTRPQQTEPDSALRILSISKTRWSPAEIDIFLNTCYEEMRLFGYSTDENYFNAPSKP